MISDLSDIVFEYVGHDSIDDGRDDPDSHQNYWRELSDSDNADMYDDDHYGGHHSDEYDSEY